MPQQNSVKIFRDGLQFVVNEQFYSVFSEEKFERREELPKLELIPKTLQDVMKYALNST